MDNFDKIIATAHVIANPEGATNELVILRRQLEVAVEALKDARSKLPYKKYEYIIIIIDDALAEIEKVKNER